MPYLINFHEASSQFNRSCTPKDNSPNPGSGIVWATPSLSVSKVNKSDFAMISKQDYTQCSSLFLSPFIGNAHWSRVSLIEEPLYRQVLQLVNRIQESELQPYRNRTLWTSSVLAPGKASSSFYIKGKENRGTEGTAGAPLRNGYHLDDCVY